MKKIAILILSFLLCGTAVNAQFLNKLGKSIQKSAEDAVTRKAEQKTDEAVSKTIDKATDPDTYKDKDKDAKDEKASASKKSSETVSEPEETPVAAPKNAKSAEPAYAKSDFVSGDEIIFDDQTDNEQPGEFPSQWDIIRGTADVISMNGAKAINMSNASCIAPLMKNMKEYLPDVFTLELDFFLPAGKRAAGNDSYEFYLETPESDYTSTVFKANIYTGHDDSYAQLDWSWKAVGENSANRNGGQEIKGLAVETFHRLAISFNKRALKVYIDGNRVINLPNVEKPARFNIAGYGNSNEYYIIKNVRIAKGAVPLYDRVAADGKFITYGITFDVGKSAVKPESMSEINRIAKLMTDNPDLKFSVEGHTDNTGTAAANQKLSDERSAAVVAKLVEAGISKSRLKSAGKGQTSPIADNSTDEGRAKNRRVEFVKQL